MGSKRLQDNVAIITGGAQGIGMSFSLRFAREGAKVVIADINIDAANKLVESLAGEGFEALAVKTDVSRIEDTLEMANKTVDAFGKIDILVNNAAMAGRVKMSQVSILELDPNEWDRLMAVNVKGFFLCSRAVLPWMMNQKSGKIINMVSDTVFLPNPNMLHYITSKGAGLAFTRALAKEVGDFNINVNCIAPGSTFAEDSTNKEAIVNRSKTVSQRALKRIEYPEDLTGTAVFLASSDSDFITGQTIVVNGGIVMH
jgi:3-oxoacyl-[acyl-carrier protein] reductase